MLQRLVHGVLNVVLLLAILRTGVAVSYDSDVKLERAAEQMLAEIAYPGDADTKIVYDWVDLGERYAGICWYLGPGLRVLHMNTRIRAYRQSVRAVLAHELAHCVYGLDHTDFGADPTLLNPDGGPSVSEEKVQELFNYIRSGTGERVWTVY
jgi:hypothetical protein